tara:strand:+ start:5078 stop:6580 length:1503 start_codon:yes stop_codon:yes gene_type:complete
MADFPDLKKETELHLLVDRKSKELEIIQQVSLQINKSLDLNVIAKTLLAAMDEYFGFKHSMILLMNSDKKYLSVLETHGYDEKGIGAKVLVGIGVIGTVAKRKKLMRMANMGMQRSYMTAIRKQINNTKETQLEKEMPLPGLTDAESQLAVPMLLDDELVGVFSVESKEVNIFDKSDELLIGILANQSASALKNARLFKLEQARIQELNDTQKKLADLNSNLEEKVKERTADLENLSKKLSKYFSPQVYDSIFSGKLDVTIQTRRKPLTVFFSDLEGFTELTERLEPETLTEMLTQYLTEMSRIAVKWGGTIDKYIGDAILVFFGDPSSKGVKSDAIACVSMALEMLEKLKQLRRAWKKAGITSSLNARIGIHSAACTVGNFGSTDRLDYTVIGRGVNLASRLETNSKPNKILISEDTFLLVKSHISCSKQEKIMVKGISYPVKTFQVKMHKNEIKVKSTLNETKIQGLSLSLNTDKVRNKKKALEALENAIQSLKTEVT